MTHTTTPLTLEKTGPGGCPVMHGFNPLDLESVNHPGTYTELARREAPVFFIPEVGMYMVVDHEDIVRVTSDWKSFPMPPLATHAVPDEAVDRLPEGFAWQRSGFMPMLQPPEHSRVRKLAQKAFTRSAALAYRPLIEQMCHDSIDSFVDQGEAALVTAFTSQIPVRVIATILGVELEQAPQIYQWAWDVLTLIGDPNVGGEQLLKLAHRHADFEEWSRALIDERRANPRGEEDMISNLLRATSDDGSPKLTDMEIFSVIVVAVFGGSDTSAGLAAQVVRRMLQDDRTLYEQALGDRTLIPKLLEEELRINFVGRTIVRMAAVDTELSGVPIPAGSILALNVWGANHDETAFEDPQRFDPDREDIDRHLGWGRGIHFCLGAPLAKVEVATAVEAILDRLPNLRLVDRGVRPPALDRDPLDPLRLARPLGRRPLNDDADRWATVSV